MNYESNRSWIIHKYKNDTIFYNLVNQFVDMIENNAIKPMEISYAAYLALDIVKDRTIARMHEYWIGRDKNV